MRPQVACIAFEEVQMSYRNDHDAALDRIAALEGELARLRGEEPEVETKPERQWLAPERSGDDALFRILAGGAGAILVVVALLVRASGYGEAAVDVEPPTTSEVALVAPVLTDDEACMTEVRAWAVRDARAADPRAPSRTSPAELMRGPVPCGRAHIVSTTEENVSSLITVYYESDPVALDGYTSAEQLWFEYHRARAMH